MTVMLFLISCSTALLFEVNRGHPAVTSDENLGNQKRCISVPPGLRLTTKLIQKSNIWFAKVSSTVVGTGPKSRASSVACPTAAASEYLLCTSDCGDIPPDAGSFPGMNSVKKYANDGCSAAALLNSKRRAARNMLSVYHASALSNSESPVLNAPPSELSFAG